MAFAAKGPRDFKFLYWHFMFISLLESGVAFVLLLRVFPWFFPITFRFHFWERLVSMMVREEYVFPDVLINFCIRYKLWPVSQGCGLHKCFCPSSRAGVEADMFFPLLLYSHCSGDSPVSLDYNFEDILLADKTFSLRVCVCVCARLFIFYLGTIVVLGGILINGVSSPPPHAMVSFQGRPLKLSSVFL